MGPISWLAGFLNHQQYEQVCISVLNLTHEIESSKKKRVKTSVVKISCPLKRYELSIVGFDWVIPQRPVQPEGSISTEGPRTIRLDDAQRTLPMIYF